MLPPDIINREAGRQRLYSEADAVVETGGIVCTYPLNDPTCGRISFHAWVAEIEEFKSHFGIRHIGLGTDSGGGVPKMLEWKGIGSVNDLGTAMRSGGLSTLEISAFMGLNFLRVFSRVHAVGQVLSFLNA